MSKVDEELKQAFTKLQEKMRDTKQKLKLADIEIEKLRRIRHWSELTVKEIGCLPEDTRVHKSVGRMFVAEDINDMKNDLENIVKTRDEKIKTLENNKMYLQRSLKESENEIREMIQQKQNKETSG